jgi:Tfp pilus assembly protein FimT
MTAEESLNRAEDLLARLEQARTEAVAPPDAPAG